MSEGAPIRSTCPYCGVGCGLLARPDGTGGATIAGDPDHPANFGRLCSKGAALDETLGLDGRLLHPLIDGKRASWDRALDHVAQRFKDTIARHGAESVAFYVSGQLLTEDYYVANKLMKGFIGAANIDTNSRLCMASSVAGHKRAFGADTVPGTYQDLEQADLVVLVGSNLAWCHPVLFQRLTAAKAARPQLTIVAIDPRRTPTAEAADLHLPLKPGSDVALFNGLLSYLHANGHEDAAFVARHTGGLAAAIDTASALSLAQTAEATGLSTGQLQRFYALFAATERAVSVYSQGVNQSSAGTDKVNAIINCHLLTGRIGRPGMGPFSITGQPNAMGGREVGGLANQLACHMEIENPAHRAIVRDFWHSPGIAANAGLKAVDMFQAVADGTIKAIWIAGTNPVDSLPDAEAVKLALAKCPFVVVSEVVRDNDTTAFAQVLLPAAAWGEKNGTVTNSERRISRQRPFLPLPGEARPDWWIFAQVASRMGWRREFAYQSAAEVFAEYAALSGAGNDGARDFDISALSAISSGEYDGLAPLQWPWRAGEAASGDDKRLFADGRFYTQDGRARFIATPVRLPRSATSPAAPLILNTGRIRDQWHTMTRTGLSARLMSHFAEPFVEIHPDDAAARGIGPASLVEIAGERGKTVARALINQGQRPGSVFMPMHWNGQFAARARVNMLVGAHTDPVSGQPELKFTPVAIAPFTATWQGFAVLARPPRRLDTAYWAKAPARAGWRLELADGDEPGDWPAFARDLFGLEAKGGGDLIGYYDAAARQVRLAAFDGDRLLGALFVAPGPVAAARSWLVEQLDAPVTTPADRLRILAGRAGVGGIDRGAIVCACLEIGINQIAGAIAAGSRTVEAVGAAVRAGTNCGSCRSEIRRLIDDARVQKAG